VPLFRGSGYAYRVLIQQIDRVVFGGDFYRLYSRFLLRFGQERQQELIRKLFVQAVKIGGKRGGTLRPQEIIGLAPCFLGKLREVILAPIGSPIVVPKVSRAGCIN